VKGSALKIKVTVLYLFCCKSLCTIFLVGWPLYNVTQLYKVSKVYFKNCLHVLNNGWCG